MILPRIRPPIYLEPIHEEYLEFELASEERHEYVNGEIRLMTGGNTAKSFLLTTPLKASANIS
jgi:hypothetical protein